MLRNITRLECQLGDRTYQLLCEQDSPLADVKEVLFQFLKYVGRIEDAANANAESTSAVSEQTKEENVDVN